jgi:hypothetical protein
MASSLQGVCRVWYLEWFREWWFQEWWFQEWWFQEWSCQA